MPNDTASALARRLSDQLAKADIQIQHTAALDLIAATMGYRNRHLLAHTALTPPAQPNLDLLRAVARRFAQHDEDRFATIIRQAVGVCLPQAATLRLDTTLGWRQNGIDIDASFTGADLASPDAFLASKGGQALVEAFADKSYFQRYWDDGKDQLSRSDANALAVAMLSAIEKGGDAEEGAEAYFGSGACPWEAVEEQFRRHLNDAEDALLEAANDAGIKPPDVRAISQALHNAIAERVGEADDSSALDLLGRERAEIAFVFGPPGLASGIEDVMVQSTEGYSTAEALCPDENLAWALASLGIPMDDYRARFGKPAEERYRGVVAAAAWLPPRRGPIVTLDELETVIENASTGYFVFCLYGIVPLKALSGLPPKVERKSLVFEGARLGVWNPLSGTFMEVERRLPRIEVSEGEGDLVGMRAGLYSPDSVCDFDWRYYHAEVTAVRA